MKLSADALLAIEESHAYLEEVGHGTGYRPDPVDPRDFKAKTVLGTSAPPSKASIREFVPPVRDQMNAGSCVGFATASAIGTIARKETPRLKTNYSPLFLYNLARMAINELHLDEGSYIRDAVKAAANTGAARESDHRYYELQDSLFVPPPPRAMKSAASFKVGAYYRCSTLADVKRAIAAGHPVVLGFLCYSNIGQANSTGRIPEPSGSVVGGHAVLAAEYDDATRLVSGPNSWGRAWGDKGFYHLPYSYFETGRTGDMWALVNESAETGGKA